ncbi:LppX_LprAFG lipoprotein [Actinoplanes sp. NPDC051411]|uniref:LppX_LprAFG lipoprotein n=1 Tax=Actinoplanes sp. NPDC051411 TaxID=3155522 RepID=UPI0034391103
MRTPRLAGLGLATTAAVALAVAGCDNASTTPGASSSAPAPATSSASAADPAAAAQLAAATAKLDQTSFKITVTSGSGFKLTGAIDAPHGAGTADVTATGPNASVSIKTLLIDKDLYVQIPGITKNNTWTHVDGSRLPADASIGLRPDQIDPVNTAKLLSSTTDVHSTGSNSYAGTLDLTKAAGLAGVSKVTIDGYGQAASQVPFTAGLDAQGQLQELTIDLPRVNGQKTEPIDALYSDYGAPVTVQRPAASAVTEAPDSIYKTLGSN